MKKLVVVCIMALILNQEAILAQNINLSSGLVFDGEPFIAQNPTNPNHLVVAWMGFVFNSGSALTIKTKTSFDGGVTWTSAVAIDHANEAYAAADPSLAIAENGDVLLCYIDHQENPYGGGVYFRRSTNGGLTWGEAVLAIDIFADATEYPIDRPWFAMSPDGEYIYLTSMPPSFVAAPNRPYLFQSNDGGATWSNFEYIDGANGLVGSLVGRPMAAPAMGQNFAYTIYPSYVFAQNPLPAMIVSRQALGLNEREYFEALATSSTSEPGSAKMGYKLLVDPSNDDHITAIFVAGEGSDLDIKTIDSYDAGETWNDAVRVNDDPLGNDRMQDLVWADYDQDGDLAITWRDRRNAPAPGYDQSTEIYCALRVDGSNVFSANFPLTAGATEHNDILEQNGNDFMSVVFQDDTLHAVWGSTIDGSLDIWYSRRAVADQMPSVPTLLVNESMFFKVIDMGDTWRIESLTSRPMDALQVIQVNGQLVVSQHKAASEYVISKQGLAKGMYMFKTKIAGVEQALKVVLP